jgi:hypothetical protein
MSVFVLSEEVDVIGVYRTYESAEAAAVKYDLFNFHIVEKVLYD